MSFTGGRLKLKGQDGGVKKRKKKKSGEGAEAEKALVVIDTGDNGPSTAVGKETREGYVLEAPPEGVDRRTGAEKRYDETQAKREAEMSKKMALKSHRERVNEFNTYLQNLSEHHDIPRVGPG